jgi:uncharacterized repeat protein (TIGR01451 family)
MGGAQMRREVGLVGACLLGGFMVAVLGGGLQAPARAVGAASTASAGDVVINEVAWMGTQDSSSDEWIELHNTTGVPVDVASWSIYGAATGICLNFADADGATTTTISAQGYLIYANGQDNVRDSGGTSVVAIWDATIGLNNTAPGQIVLYDASDCAGNAIDTANQSAGGWFAGDSGERKTMERKDPTAPGTDAANWCTNDGVTRNGQDAGDNPINGTPKAANSCYQPPSGGQADLVVAKTGPVTAAPGSVITYHVAVSNTGEISAAGARLTDTLPSAVTFVTQSSAFPFDRFGGELSWSLGDVLTGTVYPITITVQVTDTVFAAFTNRVTATTTVSEATLEDNAAAWSTQIAGVSPVYLPLIFRAYTPPPYTDVIIEAVLYDGLQSEYDEAVLLLNGSQEDVSLAGWKLCKWGASSWKCADLPGVSIAPQQRVWLARSAERFADSFGFAPDYVLSGWPAFTNSGDEVVLRDDAGVVRDAVVYGRDGLTSIDGWDGPAVYPYDGSNFAKEGQVLYRYLSEDTGFPASDDDTAADWAQYADNPWHGRRVRYPGWDLEQFFQPAVASGGALTVGVAPDNAYGLVTDTIRSAEERIDLAVYSLEEYGLVNELVQQAQAGVTVTVLLEGGPVGGVEDQELWACQQLHATGHGLCYFMVNSDTLRIYDRYTFMHAKYMIVDQERLLLGSQNMTIGSLSGDDKANGTGGSRGVVLVTDAPEVVARAVAVFHADCDPDNHADISLWGAGNALGYAEPPPGFTPDVGGDFVTYTIQFPQTLATTGDRFELVTAPESALRSDDALLGLVGRAGAGDAVYVEQLYEYADWGDPVDAPNLRLQAYIDAARRGARVRILLNGGDFGIEQFSLTENIEAAAYANTIAQAEGLDLSARLGDPTQYGIHNKMVLVYLAVEGKYVHAGSINGSETSNKVNREMALQVRSAALYDYLYAVFDYDWQHQPPQGHPLISEVMYRPSTSPQSGEWIEIYNPTVEHVDISNWYLGDMVAGVGSLPDDCGDGIYRFPAGSVLPAGGVIVVAQQAADVVGFTPDYEFLVDPNRDTGGVPNMVRADPGTCDGLALTNTGDEVVLRDASGAVVDAVTYGAGAFPGVVPHPGGVNAGHSLERRPPEEDTDDCSQDFVERNPPTPGVLPD